MKMVIFLNQHVPQVKPRLVSGQSEAGLFATEAALRWQGGDNVHFDVLDTHLVVAMWTRVGEVAVLFTNVYRLAVGLTMQACQFCSTQ